MKEQILLISNMYPDAKNPAYGIFVQQTEQQLAQKFPIEHVVMKQSTSAIEKMFRYLLFFFASWKALHPKNKIWYVHYISHSTFPVAFFTLLCPNRTMILNVHGTDLTVQGLHRKFVFFCLKRAHLVISPSDSYRTLLIEEFKQKPDSIFVSPSGGIPQSFFAENFTKMSPKAQTNSESLHSTLHIVSTANLLPDKGIIDLLQALVILKKKGLPFSCLIIGDGPELSRLKTFVRVHQLDEVAFTGRLPRDQIKTHYIDADCFVFPSHRESLGLVGLEALACSLPLIGSNIPGIMNYLNVPQNGLSFIPKSPKSLAESLLSFHSLSIKQKEKMRNEAYHSALDFRESVVAKSIQQKFSEYI